VNYKTSHSRRTQASRLLLTSHRDGYLEGFADGCLTVRHIPVPWAGIGGEVDAERVVELELPKSWRGLLWPANRVWCGNFRPSDHDVDRWLQRKEDLRLLAALSAFGRTARGEARR
jgi:hypothetical protein